MRRLANFLQDVYVEFAVGKRQQQCASGANTGISVEVSSWNNATNVMRLALPMARAIQVGDTYNAVAGCDGRLATCRDKFDNVVNFRGEPYQPGLDKMMRHGR